MFLIEIGEELMHTTLTRDTHKTRDLCPIPRLRRVVLIWFKPRYFRMTWPIKPLSSRA